MQTSIEHSVEHLHSRGILIGWIIFIACVVSYSLPDDMMSSLLFNDVSIKFSRLTRLTWTSFIAILLAFPLYINNLWILNSFRTDIERNKYIFFLFLILFFPFAARYLGWSYIYFFLKKYFGIHLGWREFIGFDSLSVLLKTEIALTVLMVWGVGYYLHFITSNQIIRYISIIMLIPPYIWSVLLILIGLNNIWFSLKRYWKLVLLILPLCIGYNEVSNKLWPLGSIFLSGLFLCEVFLLEAIIKNVPKQQEKESSESPQQELQGQAIDDSETEDTITADSEAEDQEETSSLHVDSETEETITADSEGGDHEDTSSLHDDSETEETITADSEAGDQEETSSLRIETEEKPLPEQSTKTPEMVIDDKKAQEIIDHVKDALNENNPAIRCQAIIALGKIGSQEHIELISQFSNDDKERAIRLAAIEALGAIGSVKAEDILMDLFSDQDLAVRWRSQEVFDRLLSGKRSPKPSKPVIIEKEPLVTLID